MTAATKPRIRRDHGVWICRNRWNVLIVGHGYSLQAAYDDWRSQWHFCDLEAATQ